MALLSDIGGIQQSLFIIGLFIVGMTNEKLFIASLIKEVYHVSSTNKKPLKISNKIYDIDPNQTNQDF